MRQAIDLEDWGYPDWIIFESWELAVIYPQAQQLVDQYNPEVLKNYMRAQQQAARARPEPDSQAWLIQCLTGIAVLGLLGEQLPDTISIED